MDHLWNHGRDAPARHGLGVVAEGTTPIDAKGLRFDAVAEHVFAGASCESILAYSEGQSFKADDLLFQPIRNRFD